MKDWHTHPAAILANMKRFLFLLIVPTLRGLFYALSSDLAAWAATAWLDLSAVVAIAVFAYIRWLAVTYRVTDKALVYRSGVLLRRELTLPRARVAAVSSARSIWMVPFGAVRVVVDSLGGDPRRANVTLYVSRRRLHTLAELAVPEGRAALPAGNADDSEPAPAAAPADAPGAPPLRVYRADTAHLALFAMLTSDSLGGVLFLGALVSQLGSIVGGGLQEQVLSAVNELVRSILLGVPTAALLLTAFLFAGWAGAFVRVVARHLGMRIEQRGERLIVTAGLVTRRRYRLDARCAACAVVHQSPVARAFGLETVYLDCAGFARTKEDLRVLLLSSRVDASRRLLARVLPRFRPSAPTVKPSGAGALRFIGLPLLCLAALPLLTWVLCRMLPLFAPLLRFAGYACCVPLAWLALARWLGFTAAGAGLRDGCLTLCYPRSFHLVTAVVPVENVRAAVLRQSVRQRASAGCDLVVRAGFDRALVHCVPALPLAGARALLEACGLWEGEAQPEK